MGLGGLCEEVEFTLREAITSHETTRELPGLVLSTSSVEGDEENEDHKTTVERVCLLLNLKLSF